MTDLTTGAAALRLGRAYLTGTGERMDPDRGLAEIAKAASMGLPEAEMQLAVLAATGIARRQSWADAIDHLIIAENLGLDEAHIQLKLLAKLSGASNTEDIGSTDYRQVIDIEKALQFQEKRILCDVPRVRRISQFLSKDICRWIIRKAKPNLGRALTFDSQRQTSSIDGSRSNSTSIISIADADVITALVREKIARAVKQPTFCFEPPQVLCYEVGQEFTPHFDFIEDRAMVDYRDGSHYNGSRIITFLIYLCDDFDGGETHFTKPGLKVKGQTGDAIYFANVDPSGKPDPASRHAGLPPSSGQKWLLSQWIHNRPFTAVTRL